MPSIARAASPANVLGQGAAPPQWHQVSPATRPLNLEILEVTSLSLTVALTLACPPGPPSASSPARNHNAHGSSVAKHRRKHRSRNAAAAAESDDELTAVEDFEGYPSAVPSSSTSAPPYISSAFPGTYPMRLPLSPNARPSFKELLSKGVVVTVDGRPWNRIVAHVSDDDDDLASYSGGDPEARQRRTAGRPSANDRAVVVVYGLMPGNEYQVDLKVVGNFDHDAATATATITTAAAASGPSSSQSSGTRSRANSIRKGGRSRSSSLLQAATTAASTSAARADADDAQLLTTIDGHLAIPADPSLTVPPLHDAVLQSDGLRSHEDADTSSLRQLIASVNLEKDDLLGQLKRSRRESQRTEASLRSEIEALKRAIDKTTQPDLRSRQKSLALQEQVKQAWNAAEEAESQHDLILNGMGGLHGAEASLREEWQKARAERDHAVEERDEAIEEDRKAMAKLDGELSTLQTKLDKQKSKRAKVSKENEELRQKLDEVASAQREVEKRNESIRQQRLLAEDYGGSAYGRGMGGMWDYEGPWAGSGRAGHVAGRMPLHHSSMTGLPSMATNDSTAGPHPGDLQNMLRPRQLGASGASSYAGARPFYPSSASGAAGTSAAAAVAARAGPVAMATQGLPPRSGNAAISHIGNPIGFYPPSGGSGSTANSTVGGRSFRVVSREGTGSGSVSSANTPVSPLVANVTAPPFMPANRPPPPATSPDLGFGYGGYDQQTTSLVPPQLQHRIYLPPSRSRLSPTFSPQSASASGRPTVDLANSDGSSEGANPSSAPAFPPLPSQATASNSAKNVPSGPSLASIVTRAIIPSAPTSASSTPSSAAVQKSPTGSLRGHLNGTTGDVLSHRPPLHSPAISRQLSWGQGGDGHNLTPGGEEFPPLPLSPSGSSPWGPSASPSAIPTRQFTATPPASGNSSNSSAAGGWTARPNAPSRRSSLQTPGDSRTPPP